jgi:hypothetical protein
MGCGKMKAQASSASPLGMEQSWPLFHPALTLRVNARELASLSPPNGAMELASIVIDLS